jgi:hypothetical protein
MSVRAVNRKNDYSTQTINIHKEVMKKQNGMENHHQNLKT